MPKWFDWQNIIDGKFRAGAVACGGAGGDGGVIKWITTKEYDQNSCIKKYYGMYTEECTQTKKCEYNCRTIYDPNCPYTSTTLKNYYCNPRKNCSTQKYCAVRKCTCPTSNPYYNCTEGNKTLKGSCKEHSCSNAAECPSNNTIERTNAEYVRYYYGGSGGAKPSCVWLGRIANKPVSVKSSCLGSGFSGANGNNVTTRNLEYWVANVGVKCFEHLYGQNGKTCSATVNGISATSIGGEGGSPYIQELSYAKNEETGQTTSPMDGDHPGVQAMGDSGYSINYLTVKSCYSFDTTFMCKPVPSGSITNGKNGKNGTEVINTSKFDKDICTFSDGTSVKCMSGGKGMPDTDNFNGNSYGIGTSTSEIYNYIYTWTIPYSTNYLGYGEAGSAGEYSSTKLSKIDGSLFVKLGKGGVWSDDSWKKGKKGPNGTDTVIKMGLNNISAKKVLVAKGGQGGRGSLKTDNYDLCYANDRNKSCSDNSSITCCEGKTRDSREVSATNVRYSLFDTIKSFAGNSKIIGIGLGRGAQGAGTSEGEIEVFGSRLGVNASADSSFNNKVAQRIIYKKSSPSSSVGTPENTSPASVASDKYKNKYLKPANINFKGGDGAVIITW